MSGGYSGRFSLKFLCALVCAFFAFSIAVNCFESHDVRANESAGMNCWKEYADDNSFRFGFN